jgi:hypothetical protein
VQKNPFGKEISETDFSISPIGHSERNLLKCSAGKDFIGFGNNLVFVKANKIWLQKVWRESYFRIVNDSYSKAIVRQARHHRSVKKRIKNFSYSKQSLASAVSTVDFLLQV